MDEFTGTTQAQVEQPPVEYSQGYMNLTQTQRNTIEHVERIGASLSLLGVFLIFIAYGLFKRVRTVPNTFILFASIANVGASTACFIGYAGIVAGENSALCHTQAFLLEMFMQSDPWWSLAMAINVFLVFFFALNPNAFRDYLWLYCLVCYGLPSVPAIVLLAHSPATTRYYGNATLWCWIADTWNPLRIYTYYLPIWTCIFLSGLVYLAVGYQVFHQRNQLRNLTFSNQGKNYSGSEHIELGEKHSYGISAGRDSPCPTVIPMDLSNHPGCYGTVTTQVEVNISDNTDFQPMTPTSPAPSITEVPLATHPPGQNNGIHPWDSNYSSSSSSSEDHIVPPAAVYAGSSSPPFGIHVHHATNETTHNGVPKSSLKKTTTYISQGDRPYHHGPGYGHTYSSYNRTSNTTTTGTHQVHASSSGGHQSASRFHTLRSSLRRPFRKFWAKLHRLDPIKLAYLRTSFVFAISILVTWTPSSINRVHSLLYPKDTSYPLNLASAVVLPLQGVWNAVIFAATTWVVLREESTQGYKAWRNGNGGSYNGYGVHSTVMKDDDFLETRSHCSGGASGGGKKKSGKKGPMDPNRLGTVRVIRDGSL
ncbi:hypothetical protein NEUTE1DRAFT_89881 [Neurospora tetrasperma FGSC 2508]|uniref:G-protein coupled receptors family 2 profile 2 domain-containing protein n=1 Tax=Neurospora tetrasperma (strain FGSC 2508 / ATCC MYA-4615 / P0657) TaxID=510951 RepID=F8MZB8_NEUT8|nr:uncharacterized protein NEUTE1DRAFT_89881 [Neurospora tetrasperma FGSC 2508]EGO52009.1 hypothetical protein NEUTE1DRAFT_89881 [Neurospora tetrasperma FGSC 2508]